MPFKYLLEPNGGDSHTSNAYWILAVVPYKVRVTADRERLLAPNPQDQGSISKATVKANPVAEAPTVILTSEVVQWQVRSTKSSPQQLAMFTLTGRENFDPARCLAPGDWCLFWAFDNETDYRQTLAKVDAKQQANDWASGLKFVGHLNSPRRRTARSASGARTTTWSVSAVGMSEFGYQLYFDPALMGKTGSDIFAFMYDFGGDALEFITKIEPGGTPTGTALSRLTKILLGLGPSSKWMEGHENPTSDGKRVSVDVAQFGRRLIPDSVNLWLNGPDTNVSPLLKVPLLSDIVVPYIGIQKYDIGGTVSRPVEHSQMRGDMVAGLLPTFQEIEKLHGNVLPDPGHFQGRIWDIMGKFLNEPVNEMFTSVRWTQGGKIMPTLIARQMPFSSNPLTATGAQALREQVKFADERNLGNRISALLEAAEAGNVSQAALPSNGVNALQYATTPYTSLPRWCLSPKLVYEADLGPTESQRTNFTQLIPADGDSQSQSNFDTNYVASPPLVDHADIERSGLRMRQLPLKASVVADNFPSERNPLRWWSQLMADVYSDEHMRWTGTISAAGIQEPIAVGDNLQFDGGVYHIESVSHQGSIAPNGAKRFGTEITVSNGLSVLTDGGANVYLTLQDGDFAGQGGQAELHALEAHDRAQGTEPADQMRVYDSLTHDRR